MKKFDKSISYHDAFQKHVLFVAISLWKQYQKNCLITIFVKIIII